MSSDHSCILTATGDLMLYGEMAERMRENNDLLWGFRPLAEALVRGDLLFGNFETPISVKQQNEPDSPDKYFSPPGIGYALRELGYDVVNLANNHIYDFGTEGVEATTEELTKAGLPFFGIGRTPEEAARPAIVNSRNGVKFGFLGYTTANNALDKKHSHVACFPDLERVGKDIMRLKDQVDIVVVSCHTGAQYNPYPAPETRKLARRVIERGASVYLGHHPHVAQGYERISDGLAVYSLGDFVAPIHSEESRDTFFIRITLAEAKVEAVEVVPCYISDQCRTVPAQDEHRERIAGRLQVLSNHILDGASDELHFTVARGRFFSQYVKSWIRELRYGGPRVIMRKIMSLRRYHLSLMFHAVFGIFFRAKKK